MKQLMLLHRLYQLRLSLSGGRVLSEKLYTSIAHHVTSHAIDHAAVNLYTFYFSQYRIVTL